MCFNKFDTKSSVTWVETVCGTEVLERTSADVLEFTPILLIKTTNHESRITNHESRITHRASWGRKNLNKGGIEMQKHESEEAA